VQRGYVGRPGAAAVAVSSPGSSTPRGGATPPVDEAVGGRASSPVEPVPRVGARARAADGPDLRVDGVGGVPAHAVLHRRPAYPLILLISSVSAGTTSNASPTMP
jgi:hypothetical protein